MTPIVKKRTLQGTVGAGCCAMLLAYVPQFEGIILRGYKDPIGIVTACAGHTKTAVLGRPYTTTECTALLESDLLTYADTVNRCINVPLNDGQRAALISFSFNVGPGKEGVKDGLCVLKNGRQPQIRIRFNAGDYAGGCRALTEGWMSAGDKQLPGLVKRRKIERDMCEGKIA
jgi:lysozyme